MGIAEEIVVFEGKLNELVRKYELYFLGLEKREPVKLLEEVELTARRYVGTPIVNTMVKFKYNSVVARLNSYKQYWTRINRQIEEGKYPRDRFRMALPGHNSTTDPSADQEAVKTELDGVYQQFIEARKVCNLKIDGISAEIMKSTIEKQRTALQQRHNCTDIEFRVVIEDGKPKIKARPK
jgi:hypothetical protein